MSIEYTLEGVNQAIAAAVAQAIPGVHIYDNPNQQDTKLPAVFITYRGDQPSKRQIDNRWTQTLKFDLCYMVEYNLPNMNDLYRSAAEALSYSLTEIHYASGIDLVTLNHAWHIEPGDALHYQFDLPVRLKKPAAWSPVKKLLLKEEIKYGR